MGELAMGPVGRPPLLGDREDLLDLPPQQPMDRRAARGEVAESAQLAAAGPPAMHPVVADLPHPSSPRMRQTSGDSVVDGLEDQLFDLGGDSRRDRPAQSQPDFPRTIANSIA